jgi:hypothetical protein
MQMTKEIKQLKNQLEMTLQETSILQNRNNAVLGVKDKQVQELTEVVNKYRNEDRARGEIDQYRYF